MQLKTHFWTFFTLLKRALLSTSTWVTMQQALLLIKGPAVNRKRLSSSFCIQMKYKPTLEFVLLLVNVSMVKELL